MGGEGGTLTAQRRVAVLATSLGTLGVHVARHGQNGDAALGGERDELAHGVDHVGEHLGEFGGRQGDELVADGVHERDLAVGGEEGQEVGQGETEEGAGLGVLDGKESLGEVFGVPEGLKNVLQRSSGHGKQRRGSEIGRSRREDLVLDAGARTTGSRTENGDDGVFQFVQLLLRDGIGVFGDGVFDGDDGIGIFDNGTGVLQTAVIGAGVSGDVVLVIALFVRIGDAVAAASVAAVGAAAGVGHIAVLRTVIASFAHVLEAVAAARENVAAVGRTGETVLQNEGGFTLFVEGLLNDAVAAVSAFEVAGGGAAVAVLGIAVITLFAVLHGTVAAGGDGGDERSFVAAGDTATVTREGVAVIALLEAFGHAVAANGIGVRIRIRAGHERAAALSSAGRLRVWVGVFQRAESVAEEVLVGRLSGGRRWTCPAEALSRIEGRRRVTFLIGFNEVITAIAGLNGVARFVERIDAAVLAGAKERTVGRAGAETGGALADEGGGTEDLVVYAEALETGVVCAGVAVAAVAVIRATDIGDDAGGDGGRKRR